MLHLGVEYLERRAVGLVQDLASVPGVGVVAKVGALVHEPSSVDVDDDAELVGVLLVQVGYRPVAERRRVEVPGHGVAAAPVARAPGAGLQRDADSVAGVVARAAHLHVAPQRAQMTRAHFGVGLETAAGQDDSVRSDRALAAGASDRDALDRADGVHQQTVRRRLVYHVHAGLPRQLEQPV